MDFNGLQIEEVSPESLAVRCVDSSVCSANQYCDGGYCKEKDPTGDAGPSVGECEESLPDPEEDSDCDTPPETGGCNEAGCGEPVGEEPTPCEEKEEEEEEEKEEEEEEEEEFKRCSPFADEYYKTYGKYPRGYSASYVCGECEDCEYSNDYFCEPHDSFTFDVNCNCLEKNYCLNKYGPCYQCGGDGECYFECEGCQVECMEFFQCPCDKSKKKFKAVGYYSPCRPTTAYGPGGTCWSAIKDKVEAFCTETFGDDCETCKENCEGATQQGVREYNCEGTPPEKTCAPNGYMEVPDQPPVAFATICDKDSACGCNGDPSSSSYKPCGFCEVCDENGDCVRDPECSGYFGEAQRSSNYYWAFTEGGEIRRNSYSPITLVRYTEDAYITDFNYTITAENKPGQYASWVDFRTDGTARRGSLVWDAGAYIFKRIKPGGPGRGAYMYERNAENFSGQQFLYRIRMRITEPLLGVDRVISNGSELAMYEEQRNAMEDACIYINGFCSSPRAYPCPGYFLEDMDEIGREYNSEADQGAAFTPEKYRGYNYPPGGTGRNWSGIGPDGEPSAHPSQNVPSWDG